MGIFDFLGKTKQQDKRLENNPEMLNAQLLFTEKPSLSKPAILEALKHYFENVESPADESGLTFFFPEFEFSVFGKSAIGQCAILPLDDKPSLDLPEEVFQQNWHWQEANDSARACKYAILLSDLLTRTLDYKRRVDLFMPFLVAVTKATQPKVIHFYAAKKLDDPVQAIKRWDSGTEKLFGLVNVRLFRITNSDTPDMLMDTVGMSVLGLPDFQVLLKSGNENQVARLLWNYAYYVFEHGDIIETGQTLEGLEKGSKWTCERQMARLPPDRAVINVCP